MTQKTTDFVLLPSDASEEKISDVLMQISEDKGLIEATKAQIAKLKDRANSAAKRIEQRRVAIEKWMLANETKSKRLPEATLTLAAARPSLIITDEDALPLDCFIEVTTRRPDKEMIKAKLLVGDKIEGATLSNAVPELRIKF